MAKKLLIILIFGLIIFSIRSIYNSSIVKSNGVFPLPTSFVKKQHISDEANILPKYDIQKLEEYTNYIFNESDIDIRFVFVPDTGDKTIEELALEKMQQLGIGRENKKKRGVLLLYDLKEKMLRIEVGYGLEEYFPDGFVSYLVHNHTKDFFSSGDVTTGLRLLIRMLHHRIRQEILGNSFDPKVVELIRQNGYLSGGAGVSASMQKKGQDAGTRTTGIRDKNRQSYSPQATPEAVYMKYLEWLVAGQYDSNINIFTTQSQQYLASLPMTNAYFHYILMQEYGRKYAVSVRNNIALLYFTNDPLVCPHFFIRNDKGWQMDIVAEVRNTKEIVGGVYTWDYRGQNDIYTKNFVDKLVNIKNYIRIVDGDNRELPIRRTH